MKHEQTEIEHIESAIAAAIDQSREYDSSPEWREGDAYSANLRDAMVEDGYSEKEAFEASLSFCYFAKKQNVRFA